MRARMWGYSGYVDKTVESWLSLVKNQQKIISECCGAAAAAGGGGVVIVHGLPHDQYAFHVAQVPCGLYTCNDVLRCTALALCSLS